MANGAEQDIRLTLEFDCCLCGEAVSVTLCCSGKGCADELDSEVPIVTTSVPCVSCGQVNQVFFYPTGAIRAVKPFRCFRPLPVPSLN